jgi:hypothetical protein
MKKVGTPKPKPVEHNITFSVRLRPSIVAALKEAAAADGRTLSKEVETVLVPWLKERGCL